MATQAEVLRQNRVRDAAQQIAAGNYGEPEAQELANGIPSGSNDAALAAHLEEWKAKDVSYQRAQNQEARDQIESAYVGSQQRLNAAKQEIKDRANLEKHQQNQIDNSAGERLALQMEELTSTFPLDWRPETLPMDKLRQLTDLRHQVQTLAAATGQPGLADGVLESGPLSPANVLGQLPNGPQAQAQEKRETFPDGQAVHVSQNQDGTMTVEYATGERFVGDPLTVTQKIGEAHVNTKVWARQQRAQQSQQTTEPMQLNQHTAQPTEQTASGSLADDLATRQADAIARQLGFNDLTEAKQSILEMGRVKEQVQKFEEQELAARFHATCPDFPDTEETAETVMQIISSNGWQPNLESLQAAHALAIRNRLYQPLTAEQIQIANGMAPQQQSRQAPPPMLRGNNPEISNAALSPYDMSLGDLRKAAIKQELEGSGPGYR